MEKDIANDIPKVPEQPVSNVRAFFGKEIASQISEMTPKEMESILKQMIGSREFIAILKYTSMRVPLLDATLRGIDPTKEPHKISWAQGAMAGLNDLETYIIDLNAPIPDEIKQDSPDEEDGIEVRPEGIIG